MSTLLTTRQVAEEFGVDQRTIQRWCREQTITHLRIGKRTLRFRRKDIDEALAAYAREKVEPRTDAHLRNPAYTPDLTIVPMRRPQDAA